MGKLITLVTILICVDIMFIITGQASFTLSSIMFDAIFNIGRVSVSSWFTQIIGDLGNLVSSPSGIASLLAGIGAVATGYFFSTTDTKLFIPMGITLGLLTSDYVNIYVALREQSEILSLIIFAPIIIIYTLVVVEWVRGKD